MNLKELFCGKKLKRKETIAYVLKKTGRIKGLEKKYLRLEKLLREAQTDRNRLAMRITKLELKKKGTGKNAKI